MRTGFQHLIFHKEEDEDEDEEEDDDAGVAGDFTVEEVAKHTADVVTSTAGTPKLPSH